MSRENYDAPGLQKIFKKEIRNCLNDVHVRLLVPLETRNLTIPRIGGFGEDGS